MDGMGLGWDGWDGYHRSLALDSWELNTLCHILFGHLREPFYGFIDLCYLILPLDQK